MGFESMGSSPEVDGLPAGALPAGGPLVGALTISALLLVCCVACLRNRKAQRRKRGDGSWLSRLAEGGEAAGVEVEGDDPSMLWSVEAPSKAESEREAMAALAASLRAATV